MPGAKAVLISFMPWIFFIVCLLISIPTGFALFSRGAIFFSATGRILQSILSLSCFGLMILAVFRYGWKIGLGVIFLVLVGGKIGRWLFQFVFWKMKHPRL
jgi:hypothetical protein